MGSSNPGQMVRAVSAKMVGVVRRHSADELGWKNGRNSASVRRHSLACFRLLPQCPNATILEEVPLSQNNSNSSQIHLNGDLGDSDSSDVGSEILDSLCFSRIVHKSV